MVVRWRSQRRWWFSFAIQPSCQSKANANSYYLPEFLKLLEKRDFTEIGHVVFPTIQLTACARLAV